ncbi:MAG: chemotaxis protein CheX [Candidatus Scalindua sp.]
MTATTAYDDVLEEIVCSTNEVFSTMIPMELKSDGAFYQKEDMISTDVMALVSFTGEHSGILAIFCSKEIALKITSSMLGVESTEIDQDTKDALGEVTNMIAGTLKNKVYEKFGEMHLSVPIVIAGGDLTISSSTGENHNVKFSSNVTCNSQNSWLMTPFSSNGSTFNVGFVVKKND